METPPSEVALVLFTSGSEGTPKGVELTHAGIMANVRQLLAVLDLTDADRVFNCLPLFHSFGIIATVLPLIHGCYVFLYPSPLHYRVVPTLIYDLDCTIFIGTNTFLNGYARKANPFDFRSVRLLLAAAEKLQERDGRRLGAAVWGAGAGRLRRDRMQPDPYCQYSASPALRHGGPVPAGHRI